MKICRLHKKQENVKFTSEKDCERQSNVFAIKSYDCPHLMRHIEQNRKRPGWTVQGHQTTKCVTSYVILPAAAQPGITGSYRKSTKTKKKQKTEELFQRVLL